MAQFPANIDLSSLNGITGFKLSGAAAGDESGISVASAGDVNGDGFADLIVGAEKADPNGNTNSGASYVVFGQAAGFAPNVDLSTLDGITGFKLSGAAANDRSGYSVAAAGDVNGDGFADLIIGAWLADPNGNTNSGASYVVFGQGSGFAANIDLSSLDGLSGFRLGGVAAGDFSGYSVASAGDVNGDGFADLIVGASKAPNGTAYGASYVVFGRASGFAASIDLSSLDGTTGFKLSGAAAGDYSGHSVASAGDINGDGFADLIVGAPNAGPNGNTNSGASYVVFGALPDTAVNRTGTGASQTLAGGDFNDTLAGLGGDDRLYGHGGNDNLDGGAGNDTAAFSGARADYLVTQSNGTFTVTDLRAGSPDGTDTVTGIESFQFSDTLVANINLSALDGATGFRLSGAVAGDESGISVASAGDINGDGFGDLIVGAPNPNFPGASYVVFGQAAGFAANIDLSSLDGATGFRLSGAATGDRSGYSVASAGDVNGDGFADLIIGAWRADAPGVASGASYVVFGKAAGFAANVDLSTLDGTTGFKLSGAAAYDRSGYSVASAGDVNGDGFADLIVGAFRADPNGNTNSGASYVVFGKASGFAANVDLSSLDGTTGFKLSGAAADDQSGYSVASAGDVNGDGFADLIVGAFRADPNGNTDSGASYVVFGKAAGFAANIDLSSLDGATGFKLSGAAGGDNSGYSVASAGDVNGDGFADVIVGAFRADPNGNTNSGASYVVFGKASGFAANIDLSSLDGTTGFKLSGAAAYDRSGVSVASAGDVNGDGLADLIAGTNFADPNGSYSGASYVVFGQDSGFAANIDLSTLDGTTGFKLSGAAAGDDSGRSVASAGDVNGDGFAVLIIGASFADPNGSASGASYVVFGKASGFAANIDLSTLDGTTGFKLNGAAAGDRSGYSVASAGDVNGDGFADLIVGAFEAPNGTGYGASYVVFGRASGFAANIDLSSLNGASGFRLAGELADDLSGHSVASAGDVNGDGFADLIVGAFEAPNGTRYGASYVVFGRSPETAVDRTGTAAAQTLAGGDFADTLSGLGGDDTLYGHVGDDALDGGTGDDTMIGGMGNDVYIVDSPNDTVTEAANAGTDEVQTSLASYSLAALANVENLTGTAATGQTLTGNGGANVITGGLGDDTMIGGAGNDTMIGGLGNDSYIVDSLGDVVTEAANAGTDEVETALASYSLAAIANVENLTGTAATGQTLTGNSGANVITGGIGNDTLNGGTGDDTMAGGAGNDRYSVDSVNDLVTEDAGGGSDTAVATVSLTIPTNVEALYLKGTGLTGTGSTGDDILLSAASGGANTLIGLGGNDLYYVSHTGDVVTEAASGGSDTVVATVSYTLPANIEALYLVGTGLTGTGSAGADTLLSSGGPNTLVGLGGNDFYFVNNAGDAVNETAGGGSDTVVATVSYTLPANIEALYLVGTGLTGTGSGGADTLLSSGGPNTLIGLGGDDFYFVNNTADAVTEAANGGSDTVLATVSYTMPTEVEALYLVGTGLTGTGSTGDDILLSAGGANTLIGLGGNDLYYVSHTGDTVTETAGGGSDTVVATVDYVLPANIEALYLVGTGLTGAGTAGADTLISAGGANTLIGLGGDDLYVVNNTADAVTEAANGGSDTVLATVSYALPANVEALYLVGTGLTGTGSGGADTLLSAGGANTLIGLGGDDLYYVNHTGDAVTEAANGGFDTVVATVSYTLPANVEALYLVGTGLTGTGSAGADTLVTLGANTLAGAGGNDTFVFVSGHAAGASVTDFDGQGAGQGDYLIFSGFGTAAQDATFTSLGHDQWQIHSGLDDHNETITLGNGASIHATDFLFV